MSPSRPARWLRLALLLACLLALLPGAGRTQAQGEIELYRLTLEGNQAPGWDLQYGGNTPWHVWEGALSGGGNSWALYKPGNWYDARLEATVTLQQDPDVSRSSLRLCLRHSGAGRYYLTLSMQGVSFTRQVGFVDKPKLAEIVRKDLTLAPNKRHEVRFGIYGDWVWATVDGASVVDWHDADPLPAGTLSLESVEGISAVGNVRILAPQPTPPPPGLPDLAIAGLKEARFDEAASEIVLVARIANLGAGEVAPSVWAGDPAGGIPGQVAPAPALGPKGEGLVALRLPVPPEQRGTVHRITLRVDPGDSIHESDERNNELLTPEIALGMRVAARPSVSPTGRPSPSPSPRRRPSITPPPTKEPGGTSAGILVAAAAGALLLGLGIALARAAGKRRARRPEPWPPGAPPVRLLRVWLSEGAGGRGPVLSDAQPLVLGSSYSLCMQVRTLGPARGTPGPGAARRLDVVFFAPAGSLGMENRPAQVDVPGSGDSAVFYRALCPRAAGEVRLRVGLYDGATLLQSALVTATVSPGQGRARLNTPTSRTLDYVASASLGLPAGLPRPALSLVLNQAGDTHWLGVFSPLPGAGLRLRCGSLHTFAGDELAALANPVRELLADLQGRAEYRLSLSSPLGPQERLARLESDLARLAAAGRRLYDDLFFSRLGAEERAEELLGLDAVLAEPGIISIARCRPENASVPWAALYSAPLDPGAALRLCPVFREQMASPGRDAGMASAGDPQELLDSPQRCRANPACPLAADDECTVCPFGFWGYRHQVEQPLQKVEPAPMDRVPDALRSAGFEQTSYLLRQQLQDVRLAMAVYPGLPRLAEHEAEIGALAGAHGMDLSIVDDRDAVRRLLREGGRHLYYFYCHGELASVDERPASGTRERAASAFRLKFGPAAHPGTLSAADLEPTWRKHWPPQPRPLIVLNACETVALTPERIDGLLDKLHFLGASGVVGTEIKVRTELAQPFGHELVQRILEGQSLGEALLAVRRGLLRRYNPLGLAYTGYTPATLHLHPAQGCAWCAQHGAGRQ